jgi:hypothetical protein
LLSFLRSVLDGVSGGVGRAAGLMDMLAKVLAVAASKSLSLNAIVSV